MCPTRRPHPPGQAPTPIASSLDVGISLEKPSDNVTLACVTPVDRLEVPFSREQGVLRGVKKKLSIKKDVKSAQKNGHMVYVSANL